jgi:AcrR family transcriptional regulator
MTSTTRKPVGRPKDEELPARRRQEILDASAIFFARLGYPSADLRLLADELGVAKGTLYRYFPSKKHLFLATVDSCMQQLSQQVNVATLHVESPLEKIEQALRAYFRFFDSHPHVVELIVQERAEFRERELPDQTEAYDHAALWHGHFDALLKSGVLRDVPVQRLVDTMSSLLYGLIFNKYVGCASESLESKTDDVLDIVFNGLMKNKDQDNQRKPWK